MDRSGRRVLEHRRQTNLDDIHDARRRTSRAWRVTAAVLMVLGIVIAALAIRDEAGAAPGVAIGLAMAAGGLLAALLGTRRFAETGPDSGFARSGAAPLVVAGLVVLAAIATAAYVLAR
jgi:hypothetical protein